MRTAHNPTTPTRPAIPQDDDPLLSVNDVAAQVGMRPAFIYRQISEGHLTGLKLGRHLRVYQSAVDAWLKTANTTEERWLSTQEVADRTGMTRDFLYGQIEARKLPAILVGGRVLLSQSAVDAWLKSASTAPDKPCTVADVARQIGARPATVYRLIEEGALPAIEVGGRIRVRQSAVDTFLTAADATRAAS